MVACKCRALIWALLLSLVWFDAPITPCLAARTAPADGYVVCTVLLDAALHRPHTRSQSRSTTNVTKDDLLIVIPASTERLHLVRNTRVYRKGIRTFIVTEKIPKRDIRHMFPVRTCAYQLSPYSPQHAAGPTQRVQGDLGHIQGGFRRAKGTTWRPTVC